MKDYSSVELRNVVLLGHGSAGKTSLTEALLFTSGATSRMGRVEDGTAVADFDEEEMKRHISLSLTLVPAEWKRAKINLLDTPGDSNFVGEVVSAARAADLALFVVDAVAGVEVGTGITWEIADEQNLPRMVVINKMDRENASWQRSLSALQDAFAANFVPLALPIAGESGLEGVVDLLEMKAFLGDKREASEIPADLAPAANKARGQLLDAAAEGDDELIMKYLEGEQLSDEEVRKGLKAAIAKRTAVPVFPAAATEGTGSSQLLEALVDLAPSPLDRGPVKAVGVSGDEEIEPSELSPLAALVFKTTADPFVGKLTYFRVYGGLMQSNTTVFNCRAETDERLGQLYVMRGKEQIAVEKLRTGDIGAVAKLAETLTGDTLCDKGHQLALPAPAFPSPLFAVAVEPTSKADQAKLGPTLTRICEEDPTLRWHQEPSTRQTILEGQGETHLNIAVSRMSNRFDVGVSTSIPRVPYTETITKTNSDSYRHKKQTGGAGQFAEVHMRVEPLQTGAGFEYEWKVFGGAISRSFESSIEKGIRQVLQHGAIAGYPVVDIKAIVYDGKEHPVDSKDIAFQVAGREVFKKAMMGAAPVLLEPIHEIEITVPNEYTGDIMGDLNTKRARVQGMDQVGDKSIIRAVVPLAEMQRYATELRSLTQGRGVFSMEFSHYEEVPAHLTQAIIETHESEKDK
jgi:elongation factor G